MSQGPRSGERSAERLDPRAAGRLLPGQEGHPALDRLAALAAQLLRAPASQVSLLTDVQTIAGGAGLPLGAVGSQAPLADSLCTVTATGGRPLVVADAVQDRRVATLPPVTSGQVGAYLGVPLVADDGRLVGAMCVFDSTPRAWSDAEVSVLTQLAASAVAELELAALSADYEASRVLSELAVQAGEIGTFDLDLPTGRLTWDDRMLELFGYARDAFESTLDSFTDRVHPDDRERVARAIESAIAECGALVVEYRVVRPDGTTRWIAARGRALAGPSGAAARVLGAAYDTTADREADARVARVLESMATAFFLLERDWRFAYVNARAEHLLGSSREELLGGVLWELFPYSVGSEFETHYRGAMESGRPTSFETYYPAPLDAWFEVQALPGPDGLSVYFLDVTARRAAQETAERASARAHLLGEVTAELAETLDPAEAVSRLAKLVVPVLADWCVVTLVDDDEHAGSVHGLSDVGAWHKDPTMRPLTERYRSARLAALTDDSFVMRTLMSGQPATVPSGATAAVQAVFRPGEARDLLGELAPESAAVLPLRGRGRTVGLLTMFNGSERAPMDEEDLGTARELAGRAGLALDNARLYRQQRRLAEQLQRAMLTDPPEPDHMQVVVRYQAATEAAQVGGDWYDAFLQPGGATVLVIGDVVGHDVAAGAAMGQVRTLLRALGAADDDGPAEVLRRVDQVLQTLQVVTTATAVVARVEQTPDERERGISHLRWSNAGHPPPMVINPDRTVVPLVGLQADLLLGIDPTSERVEAEVTLDRGATVLLYTDGLVERRDQSIDDGLARLREVLLELADDDLGLDELCDQVLSRMLPDDPEDDIALVAVRLHRQDRPRPIEAGPRRIPDNVPDEPAVDPSAG